MPHGPSRRSLLAAGGLGVLAGMEGFGSARAAVALTYASPRLTPYVDELPVPPVLTGDRTIAMGAATHRFHRDLGVARTWSYGGQPYLGPTVEAQRDEPVALTFRNTFDAGHLFAADIDPTLEGASELDRGQPRTSVHLHGAVTPPEADGHPEHSFRPGGSMTYRHPNGQDAAHLWYHDHAMGITRLNAVAGLAGMYLLRDAYDTGTAGNALGLPSGEFEVPLTLADRRFQADGSLNFRTTRKVPQGHWEGGTFGDLMTVNGVVAPYLQVARGFYRFRVLNASNARGYRLFFSNQMPFWVVGNDAGLLDAPARTAAVRLAPGERLDLVVDFGALAAGDQVDLTNDQQESPVVVAATGVVPPAEIIRFVGTGVRGFATPPPATLRGGVGRPALLPAPPAAGTVPRRTVTLTPAMAAGWPLAGMMMNNLRYDDGPMLTPGRAPPRCGSSSTPPPRRTPCTCTWCTCGSSTGSASTWRPTPRPIRARRPVPPGRRPSTLTCSGPRRCPRRGRRAPRTRSAARPAW